MNIRLIKNKVSPGEEQEMLKALGSYIKLAVDIKRGVAAGGSALHADCKAVLIDDGSLQDDIWGADWLPCSKEVRFEALINVRPKQGNRSMVIQDCCIRDKVKTIVEEKFL